MVSGASCSTVLLPLDDDMFTHRSSFPRRIRQLASLLSIQRKKWGADALLRRHIDFTRGPQPLCHLHGLRLPRFRRRHRRRRRPCPPPNGRRCRRRGPLRHGILPFPAPLSASFFDVGATLALAQTDSNRAIMQGVISPGGRIFVQRPPVERPPTVTTPKNAHLPTRVPKATYCS